MNTRFAKFALQGTAAVLLAAVVATSLPAQPASPPPANSEAAASAASQPSAASQQAKGAATESTSDREVRLAKYLTGATFTGMFTVEGAATAPKPESYTILACEKLAAADQYRLKVKISYGDVEGEFPMDLTILWSGSTPVITLDGVWIPGLGTFSSRVLIHDGRYAGTWQHDAKGGHLFGTIAAAGE